MSETTTKQFHLCAVMSVLTGVLYEEKPGTGMEGVHEIFYHLFDPYITLHGVDLCQVYARGEILRQHPWLDALLWKPGLPGNRCIETSDMMKAIHIQAYKNGSYVSLEGPYHATEFAKKLREQEGIPEVTQ